jgi:hypothetical protein
MECTQKCYTTWRQSSKTALPKGKRPRPPLLNLHSTTNSASREDGRGNLQTMPTKEQGRSPAQGVPGKGQYSIDTDMLQLQVGGQRGTSSLQLSRLQARQGRDSKEKIAESAQDYNGKCVLFQPHHPRTIPRGGAVQQHTITEAASAALSCTGLPRHSGRNVCPSSLEAQ